MYRKSIASHLEKQRSGRLDLVSPEDDESQHVADASEYADRAAKHSIHDEDVQLTTRRVRRVIVLRQIPVDVLVRRIILVRPVHRLSQITHLSTSVSTPPDKTRCFSASASKLQTVANETTRICQCVLDEPDDEDNFTNCFPLTYEFRLRLKACLSIQLIYIERSVKYI